MKFIDPSVCLLGGHVEEAFIKAIIWLSPLSVTRSICDEGLFHLLLLTLTLDPIEYRNLLTFNKKELNTMLENIQKNCSAKNVAKWDFF